MKMTLNKLRSESGYTDGASDMGAKMGSLRLEEQQVSNDTRSVQSNLKKRRYRELDKCWNILH